MASDPQGKKWQLTWNNPQSYGLTRDAILEILSQLPLEYFCLCDEIATTGTPHTHAFLYAHSNMRFSTIQRKFPTAHIERVQGTARQNRDYIAPKRASGRTQRKRKPLWQAVSMSGERSQRSRRNTPPP